MSKRFGGVTAVKPTSFAVAAGSFVTLLGPSGSGKTTILKIIAGFEEPSSGTVTIAGKDVTEVPPHKRNVGFVFQQFALFPHLSVAENVAYSLKMRRLGRAEIGERVAAAVDLVRLTGLQDRRPDQLSGGQQQRVALARAIVFDPPVLLMDEPMSALDKRLREEMQYEIRALQRRLGITTIAVTHDQAEALVMSDEIIVLDDGAIAQAGPPDEVYRRPRNAFVANFLGESNILRGRVEARDGRVRFLADGIALPLTAAESPGDGAAASYVLRPESIRLSRAPTAIGVGIVARVTEKIFCGDSVRIHLETPSAQRLIVKLLSGAEAAAIAPGNDVFAHWDARDATLITD